MSPPITLVLYLFSEEILPSDRESSVNFHSEIRCTTSAVDSRSSVGLFGDLYRDRSATGVAKSRTAWCVI